MYKNEKLRPGRRERRAADPVRPAIQRHPRTQRKNLALRDHPHRCASDVAHFNHILKTIPKRRVATNRARRNRRNIILARKRHAFNYRPAKRARRNARTPQQRGCSTNRFVKT